MSSNRNQIKTGAKRKMESWIIKKKPDKLWEEKLAKRNHSEEPVIRTSKRQRKAKKIFDPSENQVALPQIRRKPIFNEEPKYAYHEARSLTGTIGDKSYKMKNVCVNIKNIIIKSRALKNAEKESIKIKCEPESEMSNIGNFVDTATDFFDATAAIKQEIDMDNVTDFLDDRVVKQEIDVKKDPIDVNVEELNGKDSSYTPKSLVEVNTDGSVTVRTITNFSQAPRKEHYQEDLSGSYSCLQCPECKKYFLHPNLFDIHVESQHSINNPEELLTCRFCSSEVIRRNVEHHIHKFHYDLDPVPNFDTITNGQLSKVMETSRKRFHKNKVVISGFNGRKQNTAITQETFGHTILRKMNAIKETNADILSHTIRKTSVETFWSQVTDKFEEDARNEDRSVILHLKRSRSNVNSQNFGGKLCIANHKEQNSYSFHERDKFRRALNLSSGTTRGDIFERLKEKLFFAQHFNNHNYYKRYKKNQDLDSFVNISPKQSKTDVIAGQNEKVEETPMIANKYVDTRMSDDRGDHKESISHPPNQIGIRISSTVDCEEGNNPLKSQETDKNIKEQLKFLVQQQTSNRIKYDQFYEKILPSGWVPMDASCSSQSSSPVVIKKIVNPEAYKNKQKTLVANPAQHTNYQYKMFPTTPKTTSDSINLKTKFTTTSKTSSVFTRGHTVPNLNKNMETVSITKPILNPTHKNTYSTNETITEPFIPDKSIILPKGCNIVSLTKKPSRGGLALNLTNNQEKEKPFQGVFAQNKQIVASPTPDTVHLMSAEEAQWLKFRTELVKSKATKLVDEQEKYRKPSILAKNQTTSRSEKIQQEMIKLLEKEEEFDEVIYPTSFQKSKSLINCESKLKKVTSRPFVQSLAKSYGIEYIEK